ncbi:hypothetical protein, partial [Bradyrhizobium sp. Mp27]|uniref:hypothetical protein n=1 Tax=Bradyrhizobium sp. Mp27 TaxID=3042157 RepID=UPI00248C5A91
MNDTTAVTTGSNKITVLDAIMGSGKTTWAIDHINAAHIKNQSEVFDGLRAGPGCLDSAPLDLSGFLPGYAERGALRFCRCVGRA